MPLFARQPEDLSALFVRTPASAIEELTTRPCLYLSQILYRYRPYSTPPPSSSPRPVKIVCVADTHNAEFCLPDGDILIHAGDLTQRGTEAELNAAVNWLRTQPHACKIIVPGNHDWCLQKATHYQKAWWTRPCMTLVDSTLLVAYPERGDVSVYGSPYSVQNGDWAFQYPRHATYSFWEKRVDTPGGCLDVLVTHGPPKGHLDVDGWGCEGLLRECWRVRPKLHVFGHIHAGRGVEFVAWDSLQAAYEEVVRARGGVLLLLKVIWMFCIMWLLAWFRVLMRMVSTGKLKSGPIHVKGTIMVNAAMLGGLRDKEKRQAIVVEI